MHKKIALVLVTMILTAVFSIQTGSAAAIQPGSAGDPLVSKSYVDDKFNQLLGMLSAYSQNSGTFGSDQPPLIPSGSGSQNVNDIVNEVMAQLQTDKYMPVSISAGQIILGFEGTEIILRSGNASAYCPGENGIVNLTDGIDLLNDQIVKLNNFIIIPRTDNRGVRALTNCWFMIKGDYQII